MKELKSLTEDQKDLIKAKVGGSKLYLKALRSHKVFKGIIYTLITEFGDKFTQEVENIVSCYLSALKRQDLGFTYSRDKNVYTNFNRTIKNRKPSSYKRTIELLSLLERAGYVELYKGFRDRDSNDSMAACCLFTDKFINMVDSRLVVKFAKIIQEKSVEVRDAEGNPLTEVEGISVIERKVDSINNWLKGYDFRFGAFPKQVFLQRIYNHNLQTSGRFYFGESQTIKSYKRPSFRIEGSAVCELDYTSQHFNIMGELLGYKLPDTFRPYEIDMSDLIYMKGNYSRSKERNILKLACMMLINSGNPTASLKNVWQNNIDSITSLIKEGDYTKAEENPFYGVSGKKNCSKIIRRLKKHNSYAETFFKRKSGMWGELQNIDSEIMLQILLYMKKRNLPCLPYHDSAVARVEDKESLYVAMTLAWEKVLGSSLNCKITQKY